MSIISWGLIRYEGTGPDLTDSAHNHFPHQQLPLWMDGTEIMRSWGGHARTTPEWRCWNLSYLRPFPPGAWRRGRGLFGGRARHEMTSFVTSRAQKYKTVNKTKVPRNSISFDFYSITAFANPMVEKEYWPASCTLPDGVFFALFGGGLE